MKPRVLNARNTGPFTLDGTRTFIVGSRRAVVLDPGPETENHLRAIRAALAGADRVTVAVTHWHADHAALAPTLARLLGGSPVHGPGAGDHVPLEHGQELQTDQGPLVAVATPGHARDHLAFHWPAASSVFVGDLLLGKGDTTWVGAYSGCIADYLASLDRLEALGPRLVYPAHGEPITDVSGTLSRYRAHRRSRIEQVRHALAADPDASREELLLAVYGELPDDLVGAALRSLETTIAHVEATR